MTITTEIMTELNQRSIGEGRVANLPELMAKLDPQTIGEVIFCCGRAFLTDESYHKHLKEVTSHTKPINLEVKEDPSKDFDKDGLRFGSRTLEEPQQPLVGVARFGKMLAPDKFQCKECYGVLKSFEILRLHYLSIHTGVGSSECHLCGNPLKKINLIRHIRVSHSTAPNAYRCPHCVCRFVTPRSLGSHIGAFHPNAKRKAKKKKVAEDKSKSIDKTDNENISTTTIVEPSTSKVINETQKSELGFKFVKNPDETQSNNVMCLKCNRIMLRSSFSHSKIHRETQLKQILLKKKKKEFVLKLKQSGKSRSCPYCPVVAIAMSRHIIACHKTKGAFKCKFCSCTFKCIASAKVHMKSYHTVKDTINKSPVKETINKRPVKASKTLPVKTYPRSTKPKIVSDLKKLSSAPESSKKKLSVTLESLKKKLSVPPESSKKTLPSTPESSKKTLPKIMQNLRLD